MARGANPRLRDAASQENWRDGDGAAPHVLRAQSAPPPARAGVAPLCPRLRPRRRRGRRVHPLAHRRCVHAGVRGAQGCCAPRRPRAQGADCRAPRWAPRGAACPPRDRVPRLPAAPRLCGQPASAAAAVARGLARPRGCGGLRVPARMGAALDPARHQRRRAWGLRRHRAGGAGGGGGRDAVSCREHSLICSLLSLASGRPLPGTPVPYALYAPRLATAEHCGAAALT